MTKIKLYSLNQVALISFVGLPGAATFVLARNFSALGDKAASMKTTLWGGLFFIWWLPCMLFSGWPGISFLIQIGYTTIAYQIAAKHQMRRLASLPHEFDVQSDEKVAAVIAASLIATFLLTVVFIVVSEGLGVPILSELLREDL